VDGLEHAQLVVGDVDAHGEKEAGVAPAMRFGGLAFRVVG